MLLIRCPYCEAENIEGADECEACGEALTDLSVRIPSTSVEADLLRDRIERLWVVTDAGKPRADVVVASEGTRISRNENFDFPGSTADHIYVVDPLGNLMMRFPRDPDPSRVIKDLQRLLKVSRFG